MVVYSVTESIQVSDFFFARKNSELLYPRFLDVGRGIFDVRRRILDVGRRVFDVGRRIFMAGHAARGETYYE